MAELNLENWTPMSPLKGPPLPRFLGIYWPWYKEGEGGGENGGAPGEPTQPFNMSITSIKAGGLHLGTIPGYDVECSFYNPNSVAATRKIKIKWQWGSVIKNPDNPAEYTLERWWNLTGGLADKYTLPVTLGPTESSTAVSVREDYLAAYDTWQGNIPQQMTSGGVPKKVYFILVDDLGNYSAPASVGSA